MQSPNPALAPTSRSGRRRLAPGKQHVWREHGDCSGRLGPHSLRVDLVERAVHAHRGPQPHQLLALPEARQDGRQGRRAQVGRAEGDDGADVLDRDAVGLRGVQAQIREDFSRVGKAFFIPGQGTEMSGPPFSIAWEAPSENQLSPLSGP